MLSAPRAPAPRRSRWIVACLVVSCAVHGGGRALAAEVAADVAAGVLDLPGGGSLPGRLLPAAAPDEGGRGTLLWKSPAFVDPFEFRIEELVGLRLTAPRPAPPPAAFRCQLRGGDAIDGGIEAIDGRHVVLVTSAGERVRIDASIIEAIARLDANAAGGFVGPGGLAGWEQSPESSWQEEGERIRSALRGAFVERDLGNPARACFDIVLAWKKTPEFRLGIGAKVGANDAAYRVEFLAIDGRPAASLVRQEKGDARINILDVGKPANRLHLRLFVDLRAGRLAGAAIDGGKPVFREVTLPPAAGADASGRFRLTLDGGDVSLESLRVVAWTQPEPVVEDSSSAAVTGRDGRVAEGAVTSYDKSTDELVLEGGQKLKLAEVDAIRFRPTAPGDAESDPSPGAVRLFRRAGATISGSLLSIDEAMVRLRRPGIEEPVAVPLGDVMAIAPTRTEANPVSLPGRVGRLTTGDAATRGCLVDGSGSGEAIAWLPVGSLNASPLAKPTEGAVSAVLEYVPRPVRPPRSETVGDGNQVEVGGIGGVVNQDGEGSFIVSMLSAEGAAARDGRLQPGDRVLAIKPLAAGAFVPTKGLDVQTVMNLMRGRVGSPVVLRVDAGDGKKPRDIDLQRGLIYVGERSVLDEALATHARLAGQRGVEADVRPDFPSVLVLRSGDVVPARIDSIDADGLKLLTPVAAAAGGADVVVDAAVVKAVELDPAVESQVVDRVRADRMLMLPRSQRSTPPTHLVRLRDGDYLRGRLVRLDGETLVIELRGEVKKLPRATVARIIWLHPEMPAGPGAGEEAEANPEPPSPPGLPVQGVAQGRRMTLVAERVEGSTIRGTSPAFGPGQIDLDRIDWLLIGAAIDGSDEDLPFSQWKLRPAPEPRALRDDAAGPGPKS